MAETSPREPEMGDTPLSAEDLSHRGWTHLTAHENEQAVSDFRAALAANSNLFEAAYGLGLALKSQDRPEEAVQALDNALAILENGAFEETARALMMKRIILAQRRFAAA